MFFKEYLSVGSASFVEIPSIFEIEKQAQGLHICTSAGHAYDRLEYLYTASIEKFRLTLSRKESFSVTDLPHYPYLGFDIKTLPLSMHDGSIPFGIFPGPGIYGTTITHPSVFDDYLKEQISLIINRYEAYPIVGYSMQPIPVPFLGEEMLTEVQNFAPFNASMSKVCLRDIDDHIANGTFRWQEAPIKPLSLFTAQRTDYSLARLLHYCGTPPQHFQKFILLTNYQRYVDMFFEYAQTVLHDPSSGYLGWSAPLHHIEGPISSENSPRMQSASSDRFQMPAYHLMREDKLGITLVNIGVGASNAKNITDHLAVLRPHCWIMLGHCAGLGRNQSLGDYVLADGYFRQDHVLDDDVPTHIPLPTLRNVEKFLLKGIRDITELSASDEHKHTHLGTIVSTGNRNWELRVKDLDLEFHQSRAIALDMESTTIAANGFRFRIPYGALLCISDRPLNGELKLRASAQEFYTQRVQQHLNIGIQALEYMRTDPNCLHSASLRGCYDPPMR